MIYTLVVIANVILGGRFATKAINRFKEEGYVFSFKDLSLKEKIIEIIPFVVLTLLPIINLVTLPVYFLGSKKGEIQEKAFEILKETLVKFGYMVDPTDALIDMPKKEENYYKTEDKDEEPIRTYQDATTLWLQQHEQELREEKAKHVCPTLDLGIDDNTNEFDTGYQKSMKR